MKGMKIVAILSLAVAASLPALAAERKAHDDRWKTERSMYNGYETKRSHGKARIVHLRNHQWRMHLMRKMAKADGRITASERRLLRIEANKFRQASRKYHRGR